MRLAAISRIVNIRTVATVIVLLAASCAFAQETYLYRAQMVQAAPGKVVELIGLYQQQFPKLVAGGDAAPLWMRHSQGDRWDLLILYPMGSYADYYSGERIARRAKAMAADLDLHILQDIAWQEDLFVYGPSLDAVKAAFTPAGLFHIEIMRALPGKQAEVYRERQMESAYQKALGRPELFIFRRDRGAQWDVFSVDVYRDLKHYAESVDIPREKQMAAAHAAGYDTPDDIGPYYRSVIATHHDTIATAIKPAQK